MEKKKDKRHRQQCGLINLNKIRSVQRQQNDPIDLLVFFKIRKAG
jgi:hypothetical protein